MKEFIIYFDIAAVFINLIVLFLYSQKKRIPSFQNTIYYVFLWLALFVTFFDLETTLIRGMDIPEVIFWVSHVIAYTLTNLLPLCYAIYCIAIVGYIDKCSKKARVILLSFIVVPIIIELLMIWLSPFFYKMTGSVFLFHIDGDNLYHRGPIWFYVLYFFTIYYVTMAITMLVANYKKVGRKKIIIVLSYIFIMIISVTVQLFFKHILIQCFGISLAAIMFSSVLQTPEDFIDKTTDFFNEQGLLRIAQNYFIKEDDFLVISVILDDTVFISNAFGITQMNKFFEEVANFIKEKFPSATYVYLPQGKFCILFKNYNSRDKDRCVFEIRARFQDTWSYDTLELKLYFRLCVIECPKDANTTEQILDIIDMVSNDVRYKRSTVYARDIDVSLKKRVAYISHLLRNALAEGRFEVYYQPIYEISEERIIGAEALIRMRDDDGNFVSPEEFIPISEKTGDILRIGQFVFDSVCKTLASINLVEYGIKKIDINLSVAQCMQDILSEQILTIRAINQIPASIINLEITETAAAHTPDILLSNMKKLADEGFELSLDDYGSGYSNMSYLLTLPFKMVKIDKNIVWTAFENVKANIALASTINMINNLGMTVLAEGVETEEQVNWLKSLGCHYLQGFYFAEALPKDEFLKLMKDEQKRIKKLRESKNEYLLELEDYERNFEAADDSEEVEYL